MAKIYDLAQRVISRRNPSTSLADRRPIKPRVVPEGFFENHLGWWRHSSGFLVAPNVQPYDVANIPFKNLQHNKVYSLRGTISATSGNSRDVRAAIIRRAWPYPLATVDVTLNFNEETDYMTAFGLRDITIVADGCVFDAAILPDEQYVRMLAEQNEKRTLSRIAEESSDMALVHSVLGRAERLSLKIPNHRLMELFAQNQGNSPIRRVIIRLMSKDSKGRKFISGIKDTLLLEAAVISLVEQGDLGDDQARKVMSLSADTQKYVFMQVALARPNDPSAVAFLQRFFCSKATDLQFDVNIEAMVVALKHYGNPGRMAVSSYLKQLPDSEKKAVAKKLYAGLHAATNVVQLVRPSNAELVDFSF